MNRRKTLTDIGVAALKPRSSRFSYPDPQLVGLYIRIQQTGAKSYAVVARDPTTGKQIWSSLGRTDLIGIEEARQKAQTVIKRIRSGQTPVETMPPKPETMTAVCEAYIKRHVFARGLLTGREVERIFRVYVLPVWGDLEFTTIKRTHLVQLLDRIEDANGKRMADKTLAILRSLFNWYASRVDDFVSPIGKNMQRVDPKVRSRSRILDDDELRAVWARAEVTGTFGAFVRMCLLTAQRREKVSAMKWDDIQDGVWHVPSVDRQKGTGGELALPRTALAILASTPRMAGNNHVFAGKGEMYFKGVGKRKLRFDEGLPEGFKPWVTHDLRRTSRSLMARAGVRPDVAERVLGHSVGHIEGIYNRYDHNIEKAKALETLAALIETILNPPSSNVIPIGAAR